MNYEIIGDYKGLVCHVCGNTSWKPAFVKSLECQYCHTRHSEEEEKENEQGIVFRPSEFQILGDLLLNLDTEGEVVHLPDSPEARELIFNCIKTKNPQCQVEEIKEYIIEDQDLVAIPLDLYCRFMHQKIFLLFQ